MPVGLPECKGLVGVKGSCKSAITGFTTTRYFDIQNTCHMLGRHRHAWGLATHPPSWASAKDLPRQASTRKKTPGIKRRTTGRAQGDLKRDMTSMSSRVEATAGASFVKGSQFSSCNQVCGLSTFTPVRKIVQVSAGVREVLCMCMCC